MKCKKCGYEWLSYGESLTCPGCGTIAAMTQSEKQTLWEESHEADKLKDYPLRAACYLKLAELADERAQFAYAECLRRGIGVPQNSEEAIFWYKASARRLYPAAAYRLALCLKEDRRFGDTAKQVFFWLRVAAEFGETEAAYDLYCAYEEGDGVERSHRHALFWLTHAAIGGHEGACISLAKMYYAGDGVEKNLSAARYFLKNVSLSGLRLKMFARRLGSGECEAPDEIVLQNREEERLSLGRQAEGDGEYAIASHIYFFAARGGNAEAAYRLGLCYEAGNGVPKSASEARRRYEMAANAGNKDALLRLGILAEEGIGGETDAETAISCYTRLEEAESAEGAYRLGELYRKGACVHADFPEAIRHYTRAAKAGHTDAAKQVQKLRAAADAVYERACLAEDKGDVERAQTTYKLAAEMGHAGAAYAMGLLTEQTQKNKKGRRAAFAFYRTAAEGGHVGGIYRLGLCYANGIGVARNYADAARLLTVAAKQNYEEAQKELDKLKARKYRRVAQRFYAISSILYRKGDVAEAIKFRNIAAKLGSVRAMYVLGCHFEFGDGLPADRVKASAWYSRAVNAGYDTARGDLKGGFLRERKRLQNKNKA